MLPRFMMEGGPMIWLLMLTSALALAVFVERFLHYHRAQINSTEFLNGVRNVLKRDNVVEALAICDATPGPVSRLVKIAVLNRDKGREGVREILEDAGTLEVPRLEQKLNVLATVAQIAPLMGFLGTVLGLMKVFHRMEDAGLQAHIGILSNGVWQALISTAAGIALSIPCYAGYNFLVGRVNSIVLDMEQVSTDILNIVTEVPKPGP
ncbi:MAG: MotA/TolQ/ExbB proton channel family protein [Verrucomicrobiales bacterium]|nr:MotA/TolQ/ExbB proton channel family protein [Verrucomicrobiales bacterium]